MINYLNLLWFYTPIIVIFLFLVIYYAIHQNKKSRTGEKELEDLKKNFFYDNPYKQGNEFNAPIYPKVRFTVFPYSGEIKIDCVLQHKYKELIVSDYFIMTDYNKELDLQFRKIDLRRTLNNEINNASKQDFITFRSKIIKINERQNTY